MVYEEAVFSKNLASLSHKIIFPTTMVTVDGGRYLSNHLSKSLETKMKHTHTSCRGGLCGVLLLSLPLVVVGLYPQTKAASTE